MKMLFLLSLSLLLALVNITNFSYASINSEGFAEFSFMVHIPKNTCEVVINGTSANMIDFGNIPLNKFKSDASTGALKSAFTVKLANCRNNNFSDTRITLDGNYIEATNGFMDTEGKTFAVRISDKDNAIQASTDFFTNKNNTIWKDIKDDKQEKKYYAYLMCKTGVGDCSGNENIGKFKATLTLTFISD
ncbi:fimbrial protein [Providencia manganoxydans]|uniref:fimbrial protein n=1 Tax=Providencia TaxID=586 RepID=UPI00300CDC88